MNNYVDIILTALEESEERWHPPGFLAQRCGGSFQEAAEAVYKALEGSLGDTQEKLLNDLQTARAERDAERRKTAGQTEITRSLVEMVHTLTNEVK